MYSTCSLKSLFRDEQRRILDLILESTLDDAEEVYRRLYDNYSPLMRFLSDLEIPLPNALRMVGEFVINTTLTRLLAHDQLDLDRIAALLEDARRGDVALDVAVERRRALMIGG